ncbi:Fic family protein [Clostridioides sp. ES-S-0048-02]|uniref:Fic family protein n=1 Tax=Clostridioides sp. ES-S-0048-02 TaxID=2770777 RepID=UPI0021035947
MIEDKFIKNLKYTKSIPNSLYKDLRHNFLFHSNKIEGSTFTSDSLDDLIEHNIVKGDHTLDDIITTVNSSYVFATIIDTLGETLTEKYIKDLNGQLMYNSSMHNMGLSGIYKKIPNRILGTDTILAQPFEVEPKMLELIEWYNNLKDITLEDLAEFHFRFESIHPFQDGNGRIGRFILLKQILENNLKLIIVLSDTVDDYRQALKSCSNGYYKPLEQYFESLDDYKEKNKALWNF